MKSLFTILAIATFFEIPSLSSGLPAQNDPPENAVEIPQEELESQIMNVVTHTPAIMEAISDLSPEKVSQMMPRLEALAKILQKNSLGQLFAHIYNLCAHYDQLKRMNQVAGLIYQLVGENAGKIPLTVKQKTQMTFVYAPQSGDSDDETERGYGSRYQREMATTTGRIAQEAMNNLEQLRSGAKAAQAQVEQEIMDANEALHNNMHKTFSAARQEMRVAISAVRAEGQRMYVDMKKALNWLREELRRQVRDMRQELEASKKAYASNVNEFKTAIQKDLADVNASVQQQVSHATDELKNRVNSSTAQLNAQVEQTRAQVNDEVRTTSDAIDAQVRSIREKMQAAMDEMRKEMQSVDAELKKGIEDSYNSAAGGARMNEQMRQEMAKEMAEMRSTTQAMREKMEREIQTAIQALTREIESILTDMRKAKIAEGMLSVAVPAESANLSKPADNKEAMVEGGAAKGTKLVADLGEEGLAQDAKTGLHNGMETAKSKVKNLTRGATLPEVSPSLKQPKGTTKGQNDVNGQPANGAEYHDEEEDDETFDLGHESDGFETLER